MSSNDDADESKIEELEKRIDEMEAGGESDGWSVQDLTQLGLTRREALYILGAIAAGYTFREAFLRATAPAEAGSKEVGAVGTADKPVDIFVEDLIGPEGVNPVTFLNDIQAGSGKLNIQTGMSTPAVDTGELTGTFPGKVIAISNGEVVASIDPSTTSAPLQDAIDAVNTSGDGQGAVIVPDGIETAGDLNGFSQMSIIGRAPKTTVTLTDTTVPLIDAATKADSRDCYWDRLRLTGPGPTAGTQPAISFGANVAQFNIGSLWLNDWDVGASGIIDCSAGHAFGSRWGYIRCSNSDGRVLDIESGGSILEIGGISAYNNTAQDVVRNVNGQKLKIGWLNCGGSIGAAAHLDGEAIDQFSIGSINYEPTGSVGSTIVNCKEEATTFLGPIHANDAGGAFTIDQIVDLLFQNRDNVIAPIRADPNVTLNNNVINVSKDPAGESWYFGPSGDISVSHGGTQEGEVRSLATAGTGNG